MSLLLLTMRPPAGDAHIDDLLLLAARLQRVISNRFANDLHATGLGSSGDNPGVCDHLYCDRQKVLYIFSSNIV